MNNIKRKCKCGCDSITNYGKIWINGHFPNMKGKKHSEETKKKMSLTRKGKKLSEEHKKKLSLAGKGRIFSEKHKKKISLALLKCHPNDLYCDAWRNREYTKSLRKNYCENTNCKNNYLQLQNHHINLNKKDCRPINIMTLCVSCHVALHNKLAYRQPANPKDYTIINRPNHVSYIYKKLRKMIKIERKRLNIKGGS